MGKKSKKCSGKTRRILWFAFTFLGLGFRGLAAIALISIAINLSPLKNEAELFKTCVEERTVNGKSISASVNFCKGGSN